MEGLVRKEMLSGPHLRRPVSTEGYHRISSGAFTSLHVTNGFFTSQVDIKTAGL